MAAMAFVIYLMFTLASSIGKVVANEDGTVVTSHEAVSLNEEKAASLTNLMRGIQSLKMELVTLNEKVDTKSRDLEKKIDDDVAHLEKKIDDKVAHLTNDINAYGGGVVALTEGGHVAKKYYNEYKVSFIGYGGAPFYDDYVGKDGVSFSQCLEYCHTVREERGATWDDIWYNLPEKACGCYQRGRGHIIHKDYLHYHFF